MPIYDFKCDACGNSFEHNVAMGASFAGGCPKCQSDKVRKVFTTGGVIISNGRGGDPMPPPACGTGGCGGGGGMCGMG